MQEGERHAGFVGMIVGGLLGTCFTIGSIVTASGVHQKKKPRTVAGATLVVTTAACTAQFVKANTE